MEFSDYSAPWWLRNGLIQTLYCALWMNRHWQKFTPEAEPPYQEHVFTGYQDVPIFGWMAQPPQARGTIIGTYGITGALDNQWFLQILGRKAFAQGFAVVLFDWRAHGKTAELSPTLTSDGLYEGPDFVYLAAQAKAMGYPAPFWFTGYSLGGQLALWGIKAAQELVESEPDLGLQASDIAGGGVICPSLDAQRSLTYLVSHPLGRFLEQAIARELQKLALHIAAAHPGTLDPEAIARAKGIWGFDHELVIERLNFASVADYYRASSPLQFLPQLTKPTLIIYAADDPLFAPFLVAELQAACDANPKIDLLLTKHGGHVGYFNRLHRQHSTETDPWWAWNQFLSWCQCSLPPR
jgi:uncharacterized protein